MSHRVLFVEDEELLRTIYHRQTQGRFDVDVVAGASEALAALAARSYAVVVTDLSMPGMGGLELVQAVRAADPHVVLMLLTADIEPNPTTPGAELLFRVLVKPCPRNVLLATLEEGIAHYSAAQRALALPGGHCEPMGQPDLNYCN
jgi:CheY-like chemotaxis protein